MAQFGDFTVDRNSTKYVLGSGGTIISYATDEPAFEFNADGTYKGLLVEPAATNRITQSEDFSTWSQIGLQTRFVGSIESPSGEIDAYVIQENTSGGGHAVYLGITGIGQSTLSVFAKAKERTQIKLQNDNSSGLGVLFDLQNGTATPDVGYTDYSIVSQGNGWYRCSVTTSTTSGANAIYISNGTSTSYTGDGTSGVYIWGAQLETGPIATSYIPTSGSTVTRVKDDINLTSASSLIGQTEGTLYAEVDWGLTTGTYQNILSANDGSASNQLVIFNNTSPVQLRMLAQANGGSIEVNQGVDSTGFSGIQKIAFAYANGDQELYRNGSSVSTATASLAALGTLTNIDLGQAFDTTNQANMWIRAVALYPKRLSDTECEALTTL